MTVLRRTSQLTKQTIQFQKPEKEEQTKAKTNGRSKDRTEIN